MKTDQLAYFREAARWQHLTRASNALNISVSSISHAIRSLEAELGCKLFEKRGKNIFLTQQGRLLSLKIDQLFDHMEKIKNEVQSDEVAYSGRYRIGASPGLDQTYLLPRWSRFQKKYPDLIWQYSSHRSSTIVDLVSKGELDFGICFDPIESPLINSQTLKTLPHRISIRKGHPLNKKKNLTFKDILTYPCCSPKMYPGIETCKQHEILAQKKVAPKVDFIFESYITAAHRISHTNSWCFLPEIFADHFGFKQFQFSGFDTKVQLKLIWPASHTLPRPIAMFFEDN